MQIHIRPALPGDAPALFAVKQQIKLPTDTAESQKGGFLLGTSLEEYRCFIERDIVVVAQCEGSGPVVGFAIVLNHETLTKSILMQRAQQVQWESTFRSRFDARRLSFFEQLGMLPDPQIRVYAKYLAFVATWRALATHDALFTTILRYPVYNTAALPFIETVGFEGVGQIDETYPEYGRIQSDVYCLEQSSFRMRVGQGRLAAFVALARRQGYL